MTIKTPTAWRPASGQGSVVLTGSLPIVTNAGLPIVGNTVSHLPLVVNPTRTVPKSPTVWTAIG